MPGLVKSLRSNAQAMATALEGGDMVAAGKCLSTYWEQKKRMAPGAEPQEVRWCAWYSVHLQYPTLTFHLDSPSPLRLHAGHSVVEGTQALPARRVVVGRWWWRLLAVLAQRCHRRS